VKIEKIPKDLLKLFAKTKANVLPEDFLVISLPLKESVVIKDKIKYIEESFFSLTTNKDEITLIISENEWKKISDSFLELRIERTYKVIALELTLEWTRTGYLSFIARLLAEINIPIGIVSCYSKDFLLIKKHDMHMAIYTLTNFFKECKRLIGE
jgi:hypothetical protein